MHEKLTKDMTSKQTKATAHAVAAPSEMLKTVIGALEAKDRLPCQRPVHDCGINQGHLDVSDFYLEQQHDGWVAKIAFQDVPKGAVATICTPEASPFPSKKEAFLAGAELLCKVLTGSEELPFFVANDKLMVTGWGTGGFTGLFTMTRPAPWI